MNDARPRPLEPTPGLHHITAICGDAQRNADFYTGVLGLRLLKRTVNYDDPSTYHLYYGEPGGTPGTILTFFPWPAGNPGRHGIGQAEVIAFAVPMTAMGRWIEQFLRNGVSFQPPVARRAENGMTERVIAFKDPDGLQLELVGVADQHADESGTISDEYAIRGFYGVTLWLGETRPTSAVLAEVLGFRPAVEMASGTVRHRIASDGRSIGAIVDLRAAPGFWTGASGVGTIHHVAFRAANASAQDALREPLVAHGLEPTDPLDRTYFRSVYFREPGGTLFEIATDGPGFFVDEPPDTSGETLMLPAWLEPLRAEIMATLPAIEIP